MFGRLPPEQRLRLPGQRDGLRELGRVLWGVDLPRIGGEVLRAAGRIVFGSRGVLQRYARLPERGVRLPGRIRAVQRGLRRGMPAGIAVRNPLTCSCCRTSGFFPSACDVPYPCCSGACVSTGGGSICVGRGDGDDCSFDAQCDSGDCDGGVCEAPPCLENGEDCEESEECCGALVCYAFGAATPACCASFGTGCSSDDDCWVVSGGGLACEEDVGGSPRCCLPQGRSCANDGQCCSTNCTDGHCA